MFRNHAQRSEFRVRIGFRKICTDSRRTFGRIPRASSQPDYRKYRMNTGDFATSVRRLHCSRVTRLWTACTPLIKRELLKGEFH